MCWPYLGQRESATLQTGWHDVVVYRRGTSEGEEGPSLAKLRCVGLCDVGDPFFCGCRRDFAHPNLSRCCGLEKLWKSCLGKIREFVFEVTLFDRSRIHCTRPPEFAPGTPRSAKAGRGALVQRGLLHMLAYVNIRCGLAVSPPPDYCLRSGLSTPHSVKGLGARA